MNLHPPERHGGDLRRSYISGGCRQLPLAIALPIVALILTTRAVAIEAPPKPSVGLDYKIYIGGLEALAAKATIAEDSSATISKSRRLPPA